ncbi:hypothetical protein [Winogradskyella vidalii]|uniref:hypothetical protein n=1 Tax=Winogradskyella vidalii TaxID=2615024 RepID=UPI0015CB75CD|nr:hypothetical protein [Winogradskyella vidalii]
MTEKQIESVKRKIAKIKKGLAADKKHWGGFHHDSGGLRYLPPELYLKIQDYTGSLRYFNWFSKNFPEDSEHPIILFEWAVTLYKTKRIQLAEKKIKQTFFSNTLLLDMFLGKAPLLLNKSEQIKWEHEQLIKHFKYSKNQVELTDFTQWLDSFMKTESFLEFANKLLKLNRQIEEEPLGEIRSALVERKYKLLEQVN